jgi:uncharacterized delta-60 repeat protein
MFEGRRSVIAVAYASMMACDGYESVVPKDTAGPNGFDDGIVEINFTALRGASDVLALPDGRLVLAGNPGGALAAMRLLDTGFTDPSFGQGGIAEVAIESRGPYTRAVRRATDGTVLLVGHHSSPPVSIVVRLLEDGTLDQTFGAGGYLQLMNTFITAFDVLPDGRIYLAGSDHGMLWMARYTRDGAVDTAFGSGGSLFEPALVDVQALVALPDGRVVVLEPSNSGVIRTLRLNGDGTRDAAFGTAGVAIVQVGAPVSVTNLARLADDRLVVAGYSEGFTGFDLAAIRLTTAGALDPSFGGTGIKRIQFPTLGVALDAVVAGDDSVFLLGATFLVNQPANAIVVHLGADGTPDPTFGTSGVASTPHNRAVTTGRVIVQPDGKVVALVLDGDWLVRFTSSGVLDKR